MMSYASIQIILKRFPASVRLGTGRLFVMSIEFITMIYLMRMLGPEPFGLLALVMSLIVILRILQDGGSGAFVVTDEFLTPKRIGAAVVVSVVYSVVGAGVALASTPLVVAFYGNDQVGEVWVTISLLIIFSGLSSVPVAIAQKTQRFFLMAWIPVGVHIIAAASSVVLTIYRQDVWPIVVYHVVVSVLMFAVFWFVVRPKVKWPESCDVTEVFQFSKGLMIFEFLNVLNRNADDILIGKVLGVQALGLYGFAYRMLSMPLRRVGGMFSTLALPRLARLAPDFEAVSYGLASLMREVALFTTPICVGVALAAPELISVVVGDAWEGALVPLQIFALLGIYQTPFSMLGLSYLVSKDTSKLAKWGFISTPIIILSFFIGLPWGIEGVASSYAIATLLLSWPMVKMSASVLNADPWVLLRGALLGIGIGLILSLPVVLAHTISLLLGGSDFVVLLSTVFAGTIVESVLYVYLIRDRDQKGSKW